MSAEGVKKRGVSGAANAKAISYRYIGGSHDHPILLPRHNYPMKATVASSHRETSTYARGVYGGILAARCGYDFDGRAEAEAVLLG